jgi:hypothetical protein
LVGKGTAHQCAAGRRAVLILVASRSQLGAAGQAGGLGDALAALEKLVRTAHEGSGGAPVAALLGDGELLTHG